MASFPGGSGGGPNSGPGLNTLTVYAAPNGSDSNDGLTWSAAKKTGYAAYQKIVNAGAGRLYFASGTAWGGPVPGQGCWLRGDDCTVPGWLPAVPSIIEGVGAIGASLFAEPGQCHLRGGGNLLSVSAGTDVYRQFPSIWLTCTARNIVQFKNIKPITAVGFEGYGGSNQTFQGWRIGWDYPRHPSNGSIFYLDVTSAQRAAGHTTLTIDLSTQAGIAVTSATRSGGIVTLTIPTPATGAGASFPPWSTGTWIYFTSSDEANFPSGAFQVTNGASLEVPTQWTFSYAQAGADHTTANAGSVKTTCVVPGGYIDTQAMSAQFPPTQYKVSSSSIIDANTAHVVVIDLYGGHNGINATQGPDAQTGRMAYQERGFGQVLAPSFDNCANWLPQFIDGIPMYYSGPGFDFGACNAIPPPFSKCALQGYFPHAPSDNVYDPDRMSAIFAYGGSEGMASINMSACTGNNASLRYIAGSKTAAVTIDLISDTGDGYHPPAYQADLTAYVDFRVVRADVADAVSGGAPLISGNTDPSKISGTNLPVSSPGIMPTIGAGVNWLVPNSYPSTPWVQNKVGVWTAELKLSGKHPAGNRQISPAHSRFKNLVLPVASWTNTHGTMTTGQTDPQGGSGAVKLSDTGDGDVSVTIKSGLDTDTSFAANGFYVIAGWVNFPTSKFNPSALFRFNAAGGSDLNWGGSSGWSYPAAAAMPGWQYIVGAAKLVSGSASQSYDIIVNGPTDDSGGDAYIFGMSAFWIPPTVDQNDAAEFIGTLRAQPQYLPPGMTGTFENQKFIAHGGIGSPTPTKTLGTSTGKVMPVYDIFGTLVGYVDIKNEA